MNVESLIFLATLIHYEAINGFMSKSKNSEK